MKIFIALFVTGIIVAIVSVLKTKKNVTEIFPYEKKKPLTQPEQILYHKLVKCLPDKIILSQVQYSQFLNIKKGVNANRYRNQIDRKSVDFLILNKDASIIGAIELDEKSHDTKERKESDEFKDKATTAAGIKLHRWRTTKMPEEAEIQAAFLTI